MMSLRTSGGAESSKRAILAASQSIQARRSSLNSRSSPRPSVEGTFLEHHRVPHDGALQASGTTTFAGLAAVCRPLLRGFGCACQRRF